MIGIPAHEKEAFGSYSSFGAFFWQTIPVWSPPRFHKYEVPILWASNATIQPIQTLQNQKTGQTPPNPTLTAHRALKAHTSPAEEVTRHTQSGWGPGGPGPGMRSGAKLASETGMRRDCHRRRSFESTSGPRQVATTNSMARSARGKQAWGYDDGNQSKSICYIYDRGCSGTHREGTAAT